MDRHTQTGDLYYNNDSLKFTLKKKLTLMNTHLLKHEPMELSSTLFHYFQRWNQKKKLKLSLKTLQKNFKAQLLIKSVSCILRLTPTKTTCQLSFIVEPLIKDSQIFTAKVPLNEKGRGQRPESHIISKYLNPKRNTLSKKNSQPIAKDFLESNRDPFRSVGF